MDLNNFIQESTESDRLLNRGIFYEVNRPFWLGGFIKKNSKIKFTIKELYLGTLDFIDSQAEKIETSGEDSDDVFNEIKTMAKANRRRALKIVSYAILNNSILIFLFSKSLRFFLKSNIRPSDLKSLSIIVLKLSNYRDFLSAIRLMQNLRTTAKAPEAETTPERIAD